MPLSGTDNIGAIPRFFTSGWLLPHTLGCAHEVKKLNVTALRSIFKRKTKTLMLGIVGEVNAGKTTLANRMGIDLANKPVGVVSPIPHETRDVVKLENCILDANGHGIVNMTIVDTPGIATYVDYRKFVTDHNMTKKEAIERAKEATKGVIKAIESLDQLDAAIVVVDTTHPPFNQVNLMILGNLQAKNIPVIVAANKIDLPEADLHLVEETFSGNPVVPISALHGHNMEALYEAIAKIVM